MTRMFAVSWVFVFRSAAMAAVVAITAITALSLAHLTGLVSEIRTSERSKPAWIVSRVEFDLLRFQRALAAYRGGELPAEALALRFDILWSRLDVATSATTGRLLAEFGVDLAPLERAFAVLRASEEIVTGIETAPPAAVGEVVSRVAALEEPLRELTLETLVASSAQSQRHRGQLLRVAQTASGLTALLVIVLVLGLLLLALEARRQRRRSRESRDLLAASRAAAEARDQFVSVVNHELRTPLTSIKGSLGLLRGGAAGPLPAQARDLVEMAHGNSESLSLLINDLLDLDKAEAGQLALHLERREIGPLVREAIAAHAHYAGQRAIAIEAGEIAAGQVAEVDRQRLGQVLANLLSNAVKFSEPDTTVTVSVEGAPEGVRIAVRDRGLGIPEDRLEQVFERFQQLDGSAHRARGGTGLGLSIARAIVARHGGTLTVESILGTGSTFTILLPHAPASAAPSAAGAR